jgi:hypothetical protein
MTQAMNLANFSNYLDTSGQVAPTVLNAPVPVSKGGTGSTTATGTGLPVLATSPTISSPTISNPTISSPSVSGGTFSSPTLTTPALGTPSAVVLSNATGLPLTTGVTGVLPIANGGSGSSGPSLVAGSNVSIGGSWPNQTVNSSFTGLGYSQSYANAGKSFNTTYTNSTGKPIFVVIQFSSSNITPQVNGVSFGLFQSVNDATNTMFSFVVPVGATYRIDVGRTGIGYTWTEMS